MRLLSIAFKSKATCTHHVASKICFTIVYCLGCYLGAEEVELFNLLEMTTYSFSKICL